MRRVGGTKASSGSHTRSLPTFLVWFLVVMFVV
jgi:hypothetical protein